MNATDKAKKIQYIAIGGVVLLVVTVIGFLISRVTKDVNDANATAYGWEFQPDEENLAQSKYMNKVEDDVKGIEGDNKATQEQLKETREQLKALQVQMNGMQGGNSGLKPPPTLAAPSKNMQSGFLQGMYDRYPAPVTSQPVPTYQSEARTLPVLPPPPPVEKPIYVYEYENGSIAAAGKTGEVIEVNASGKSGAGAKEKKRIFVPSTTQVKVVLINGFNAPTLTNGKNVLAPVTVKAVDNFMLPTGKRMDFKSCNFMGEAMGKLSDNRADPRFTTMACIDKNNNPIDIPISAYLTDEYGSVGIEGTPVTLQNKLIEGALWASAIGGFSNIASQKNMLLSQTALGTTTTGSVNTGDQMQAGFFGGIAKTGQRLEDFLFDNIKTLETVIQVKGRRNLVLHFTRGFYIYEDGKEFENVSIQEGVKK